VFFRLIFPKILLGWAAAFPKANDRRRRIEANARAEDEGTPQLRRLAVRNLLRVGVPEKALQLQSDPRLKGQLTLSLSKNALDEQSGAGSER